MSTTEQTEKSRVFDLDYVVEELARMKKEIGGLEAMLKQSISNPEDEIVIHSDVYNRDGEKIN